MVCVEYPEFAVDISAKSRVEARLCLNEEGAIAVESDFFSAELTGGNLEALENFVAVGWVEFGDGLLEVVQAGGVPHRWGGRRLGVGWECGEGEGDEDYGAHGGFSLSGAGMTEGMWVNVFVSGVTHG
jgi:hypothetical protein